MAEYPNLNQQQIDITTTFFTQVDTNNDGQVSIAEIKQACYNDAAKSPSYVPATGSSPLGPIKMIENIKDEAPFTESEYAELQQKYPELSSNFVDIDTDSDGIISLQELENHYLPKPVQLPITYVSEGWIENLKANENLEDASLLTLPQLLSYENQYNTMRYWPINQ
jgi:Ca2+-binding EF-hand superfamily protein